MKHQIKKPSILKSTLIVAGLLITLSIGLNSCGKEDFFNKFHHKGGGHSNKGGGGKDTTDRSGKGGGHRDTTTNDDTCVYYYPADVDDLELTNGQTFNPTNRVYLKVTCTAGNGCAKSLRFSEKRKVNKNVVDIYLTTEIFYEGCFCTEALTQVEDYYEVEREKGTGTLEYRIHYTDAQTQTPIVKFFYY